MSSYKFLLTTNTRHVKYLRRECVDIVDKIPNDYLQAYN